MIKLKLNSTTSFAFLIALSANAHAQKILHTHLGQQPQLALGRSVAGAGDVNNDGYDDYMSGTPAQNSHDGGVWVFSGDDGALLYNILGPAASSFGAAVAGVGDVNMDGFDDFAGSSLTTGALTGGRVLVYSGANGNVLLDISSASGGDLFGSSIIGLGELNSDGRDDFAVSAENGNTSGTTTGEVTIHSGADGSILRTFFGDSAGDDFGIDIGAVPDMDNDGLLDLVIGARRDDNNGSSSGSARAVNPATGAVHYTVFGDTASDEFGYRVDGSEDINGDGGGDVIVGTFDAGYARVFTGTAGNLAYTVSGSLAGRFARSVAGLGDIDGDGFGDLAIGAPFVGSARGEVHVVSGVDGSGLFITAGTAGFNTAFGDSLALVGDANADGIADWIVGATGDDLGAANGGRIEVIGGSRNIGTKYCSPAVVNSTGLPGRIFAYGSETVSDQCLTLIVDQIGAGQFGFFITSRQQGVINPPVSQGTLCLSGNIARFNAPGQIFTGPFAELAVDLTAIPANPNVAVVPGDTWHFTCWYRDANPAPTNNFSDAVSVTFQ